MNDTKSHTVHLDIGYVLDPVIESGYAAATAAPLPLIALQSTQ